MCGIFGVVSERPEDYSPALRAMMQSLRHRGPDGDGLVFSGDCALGHTRLSIVDLASGSQPMESAVAKHIITFNGEIYGYREIRARLKDYPFKTQSDTEVILALYGQRGDAFVDDLPGMFAFALWDEAKRTLTCARDRFGEKPFYYSIGSNGEFVFASEIKAILASGLVKPRLKRSSILHYLQHLFVHPEETIYENVFCLPPAHRLSFCAGRVSVSRYWAFPQIREQIGMDDAVDEFRHLLDSAVQRQLVADVPVSVFLSGGLDSSTMVSLASRHAPHVQTLAFGFVEGASELGYARMVADRYQTRHVELTDELPNLAELLLKMGEVYDEPFADSSNIPTFLICRLAREHGKVVLSGDGGDELLAGYNFWYDRLFRIERLMERSTLTLAMMSVALRVRRRLGLRTTAEQSELGNLAGYARQYHTLGSAHEHYRRYFDSETLEALLVGWSTFESRSAQDYEGIRTMDGVLRADTAVYLPGDILVKTDRASMANGLELRAPFLDVDVGTFCLTLPMRLKADAARDKLLLRESFGCAWPEAVRTRGKQGFNAPITAWLARSEVRELKRHYLDDRHQPLFSIVSYQRARSIVAADDYQTWILLVLAIWLHLHPAELP